MGQHGHMRSRGARTQGGEQQWVVGLLEKTWWNGKMKAMAHPGNKREPHPICPLQLRVSDLHGVASGVRDEVPRVPEHGAPRPRHQELPRRTQLRHQDLRLRDEPQPLQHGLLQDRRKGSAAHTVDGLGEHSAGE